MYGRGSRSLITLSAGRQQSLPRDSPLNIRKCSGIKSPGSRYFGGGCRTEMIDVVIDGKTAYREDASILFPVNTFHVTVQSHSPVSL